MEHQCTTEKSKEYHTEAKSHILVTFFLSLIFNFIIIFGGIYTNSVAIVSDAIHDLSDTFCLLVSWFLEKYSLKKKNDKYTYGYQRLSVLGAVITSCAVIFASIIVIYESLTRLLTIVTPDAKGMFVFAIIGIVFKGYSVYKVYKGQTYNEKAISYHMFGDVLRWVAILVLSILLMFWNLAILDPIISLLIAIWLIYALGKTLVDSFRVLLQKVPSNYSFDKLKEEISEIDGVEEVVDLHLWSLDGIDQIITAKLRVNTKNCNDLADIRHKVDHISGEFNASESTVEFIFN
ncbi:metal transporter [Methanobrevibacter sp. 87.7]|uniref:cation diffusion facilitator family transporter n=1 Tax=Methanobrevibacter sp. 87.7 TaxID=387957 RepID=UPI000B5099AB|nr:cation diffusion facilitator family transporter [Methanobrevibacter sp. 87.7]OWT32692.1 metal transporter [Methanobrevibacter sp. 87.7]